MQCLDQNDIAYGHVRLWNTSHLRISDANTNTGFTLIVKTAKEADSTIRKINRLGPICATGDVAGAHILADMGCRNVDGFKLNAYPQLPRH